VADQPTYHVRVWQPIPTYLCLFCSAEHDTLEELTPHLLEAHGLTPVPTVSAADLLILAGHEDAATHIAATTTTTPTETPAHAEEPDHG
jgi:hypothetical protein